MTDAGEIADLGLTAAADGIASGRFSSEEVTAACLSRLRAAHAALGCVTECDERAALAAARRADAEQARGNRRGVLHGVPLAHKDMFYRAGRLAGCGSRILVDHRPTTTATVLARLDAAGALDIARLHMSEFALGATGHSDVLGHARNPWDPSRAPGGSSSGSAIAVAAGGAYGALGSDTGGSVRQPAAFSGTVGLKPTAGRVSRHGMMPSSHTVDCVGWLTRTVADSAMILGVVSGPDPCDPTTDPRPAPAIHAWRAQTIREVRIGVPRGFFAEGADADVMQVFAAALEVFQAAGGRLVPVETPSMDEVGALTSVIVASETAALHRKWLRDRPHDYGAQTLARLRAGLLYPATRYIESLSLRASTLEAFAAGVFARADVLCTPTMPMVAPDLGESDVGARPGYAEYLARFGRFTRPASYLGLPALSLVAGWTASGLPCGVQLIGRPFDEATLLRVGAAFEHETQFPRHRPVAWRHQAGPALPLNSEGSPA